MTSAKDILLQPITILNGVGKVVEQKLNKIEIYLIRDVILHLPIKYLDKTRITPLSAVREHDHVLVQGEIAKAQVIYTRKKMLLVTIVDRNGYINLRFFNFSEYQKKAMKMGQVIRCFGEVRMGNAGYEIIHPEYSIGAEQEVEESLTPIYPLTSGISQKLLQSISNKALELLSGSSVFNEFLSDKILNKFSLLSITDSLEIIHKPTPNIVSTELESFTHPARYRLIFDELLAYQLSLLKMSRCQEKQAAIPIKYNNDKTSIFIGKLKFDLTNAQKYVFQEILEDLNSTKPMMRLVQGDVGCGKTIIAALAALQVIEANLQVAIMSPTEILAEQHYDSLTKNFAGFNVNAVLLSGRFSKGIKEQRINSIKEGTANLVIGTHALFQEKVEFNKLGLIIIDEQHRFGVAQRLSLRDKSKKCNTVPHQLVMSATPIPRTLAMAMYADLNISVVDEMPIGRQAVKTVVIPNNKRDMIIDKITSVLRKGQQAYWVCPLIETSDVLEYQAAIEIFEKLNSELTEFKVGLIHGKLKGVDKENIIRDFQQKKIDLLVATTVIEVGVDIANAVLMIIENAERLGLSQLHQLRGRVGRGEQASYCVLMYQSPLSENSKKRLEIIRNNTDGFIIAKQDLLLRGIGEMFGTNQTGLNSMKIASFSRDHKVLNKVRSLAEHLLEKEPNITQNIIDRWYDNRIKFIKA